VDGRPQSTPSKLSIVRLWRLQFQQARYSQAWGDRVGLRQDWSRWRIALPVIVVIAAAVGAATWLLCSHVWHLSLDEVIAITSVVVLAVIPIVIEPAKSWVEGDSERRRASQGRAAQGAEVRRTRARRGSLWVKAPGFARFDRVTAKKDIVLTIDALPPGVPSEQDGEHGH
jgi:hypothetical protein